MKSGLRAYTSDVQQFRAVIEGNPRSAVGIKPDSFAEAKQKIALFELQQRARDAGLACCGLELAS